MTVEEFALYLEHYVDGRLREAFGLGPLNNPLQHPNCPVCGMQPTMVIDANQKRRYDCACGNTWKEPQPPLQDQK